MKSNCRSRISALLMALVLICTLIPTALAAGTTLRYKVKTGESVSISTQDLISMFEANTTLRDEFDYLEITSYSDLDDYGNLVAKDSIATPRTVDERDLRSDPRFCISRPGNNDYFLDGFSFEANKDAPVGTLRLGLKLTGQRRNTVDCTLEIEITRSANDIGPSGKANLTYYVDERGEVRFDRDDFARLYNKSIDTEGSMTYLVFTDYDHLDDYGYLLATNEKKESSKLREADLSNRWFYYDPYSVYGGDYNLTDLTFVADSGARGNLTLEFKLVSKSASAGRNTMTGTLEICLDKNASKGDVHYNVQPGKDVRMNREDFYKVFQNDLNTKGSMTYLVFTEYSDLDDYGQFTATSKEGKTLTLHESDMVNKPYFYYDARTILVPSDYSLESLTFQADKYAKGTLRLGFQLVDKNGFTNSNTAKGVLTINIAKDSSDSGTSTVKDAKITYTVTGDEVKFKPEDFKAIYDKNCSGTFQYVEFTDSKGLEGSNGFMYSQLNRANETLLTNYDLGRNKFGADDYTGSDYFLSDLSFVPGRHFKGPVVLDFRVRGTDSRYVEGQVILNNPSDNGTNGGGTVPTPKPVATGSGADIRYNSSGMAPVKIQSGDLARFYSKKVPGGTLQSVVFTGVPTEGSVVYNYNNRPVPGSSTQMVLTPGNALSATFYAMPSAANQFSLSELSYVPTRTNYCATIPFTAFGTGGSITGGIQISVTLKPMKPIVGILNHGVSPIPFPYAKVYNTVLEATGMSMAGMRFLELPDASKGLLFMSNGSYQLPISLQSTFGYSSGSWLMKNISFVPATPFRGNVELPFAAYDNQGVVFATGSVSIGVVEQVKTFSDVNSSTWCYQYVSELAGNGVIGGYKDGTFKEKNPLTWGAALKLICLANDTGKQGDSFETFLQLATAKGWVSGTVNLKKNITRQEFCQVAAKAMSLAVNPAATSPFNDCKDPYVVALNAAGIINGYETDGVSVFKPNNTLTRGHISAIIWRMAQYQG